MGGGKGGGRAAPPPPTIQAYRPPGEETGLVPGQIQQNADGTFSYDGLVATSRGELNRMVAARIADRERENRRSVSRLTAGFMNNRRNRGGGGGAARAREFSAPGAPQRGSRATSAPPANPRR